MDEATKAELSQPLKKEYISSRQGFGGSGALSYIQAHHAIREANRIFGFDGWNRETIELSPLGDVYKDPKGKWRIGYRCKVRITVGNVVREGTGFGNGIDNDPAACHELAMKEAESDAMKRALMTFGDPFGLALYDKEQKNVEGNQPQKLYVTISGKKKEIKGMAEGCKMLADKMKWHDSVSSRQAYLDENREFIDILRQSEAGAKWFDRLRAIVGEGLSDEDAARVQAERKAKKEAAEAQRKEKESTPPPVEREPGDDGDEGIDPVDYLAAG